MSDIFRLKIVSKRQVTLPQLMLEALHLREGDELEVEVDDGEVVAIRPLKLVPTTFFTKRMLKLLKDRSTRMDAGDTARADRSQQDTPTEVAARTRARIRAAVEQAGQATAADALENPLDVLQAGKLPATGDVV